MMRIETCSLLFGHDAVFPTLAVETRAHEIESAFPGRENSLKTRAQPRALRQVEVLRHF